MLLQLLTTLVLVSWALATASDFYTAAVVELATPSRSLAPTSDEVLIENTARYIDYIYNASLSKVDIIVFPEDGLRGHNDEGVEVPSATDRATPCDNNTYHQVLAMLSCAARQYGVYVVVTLAEIYNKTTPQQFTTSLAFDRNGTVVARYRKYHPYGRNADKPPLERQYFKTDFGVTFGMLISFDIQFLEPGIILARDHGIKHFVFPNCWVSALPFFTAVQTQCAWAYGLDVVLLASGCDNPPTGGTGSGVYLGQHGALRYLQTSDATSAMIIARVPINPGYIKSNETPEYVLATEERSTEEHMEETSLVSHPHQTENNSLFLLRDYVDVYDSLPVATEDESLILGSPTNSSVTTKLVLDTILCHNLLCCRFQVTVASSFSANPPFGPPRPDDFSSSFHRLVTFDGVRSYGGGIATGGIQVCGIISCVNESMTSCGLPANHESARFAKLGPLHKVATVFESVSISASLMYNSTFVYPDILVSGEGSSFGSLVSSDSFTFQTSAPFNGLLNASLKITNPAPRLVSIAIYARQFDRDGLPRTELPYTSQAQYSYSVFGLIMFLIVTFNFLI